MKNSILKIHKGDTVRVMVGKDRGREAKVEQVFPKHKRVLLPGINQYKKHRKPQGEGKPGEIVTLSRPITMANVALICPKCKQPTRIGYRIAENKKSRICRKCENVI